MIHKCEKCGKEINQSGRTAKELVRKLRAYADQYNRPPYGREIEGTDKLLSEVADVIEEFSAKLHNPQMERSSQYYNGGWIPLNERLPEISDWYIITVGAPRCTYADYYDKIHNEWQDYCGSDILAWMPMPRPYMPTEG